MTEKKSDFNKALENPQAHFSTPMDIVSHTGWSFDQKKRALDKWEQDAVRLSVAAEEGMGGGEPSNTTEVSEAKAALGIPQGQSRSPAKGL